jgi:hypothetical protein
MNTEMSEQTRDEISGPSTSKKVVNRFAATLVVLAMIVAALSLWTVIPLTWVWIGSRVSQTQAPSGGPYMVVLAGIVVSILLIAWLISRLNHLYVRITGTYDVGAIRPRWLRSMRDEREHDVREKYGISAVERIVVICAVAGVLAFELWFFFFAGSSLPNG